MTAVLDAALVYATCGWAVFAADGKIPFAGTHGSKDATTNENIIREWWYKWPKANCVVVCGDKLSVLDVDTHTADGKASLAALQAQYGTLPLRPTSYTGGGGIHLLFAFSAAVKTNHEFAPGLHFVPHFVAPPSVHPNGTHYQWDGKLGADWPPPPVPGWLVELVKAARTPNRAGVDGTALRLERGQRDIRLYHEGCALRGRGYPEEAIYEALLAVNRWCCEPPLPESVVRTKAHSAAQHPLGIARPAGKTDRKSVV